MSSSKPYKLPKVAIRMVKEPPLYSSEPVNRPDDAVRLIREMLESYNREALVIVNIHNHPSGDITPSAEDIRITNNMYSICKLMDIPLRDQIVIGNHERYFSFAEHEVF